MCCLLYLNFSPLPKQVHRRLVTSRSPHVRDSRQWAMQYASKVTVELTWRLFKFNIRLLKNASNAKWQQMPQHKQMITASTVMKYNELCNTIYTRFVKGKESTNYCSWGCLIAIEARTPFNAKRVSNFLRPRKILSFKLNDIGTKLLTWTFVVFLISSTTKDCGQLSKSQRPSFLQLQV